MKPGKHQWSKQRCQHLCWKVHDRAQSFDLLSYINYVLIRKAFLLVSSYCVLCTVKAKKVNKNLQQRNLSGFITIPLTYNYV